MQELNYNGQIVLQTMERYNLVLLNGAEECQGTNTREQGEHRSAIDFMLVNQSFYHLFDNMYIDKEREQFDLSDHFLIRATFAVDQGMTVRNDGKLMEVYYYKMNEVRLRHLFLAEVEKELTLSPNLDI